MDFTHSERSQATAGRRCARFLDEHVYPAEHDLRGSRRPSQPRRRAPVPHARRCSPG